MKYSTYKCKTCGEDSKWSHQKLNVYCSIPCATEGKLLEMAEKFNRGELTERAAIRKALAKLNGYYCAVCKISEHNNMPITLQVDHIDGNAGNNRPVNLRLICPNCHSQTKTFGARNKGNGRKSRNLPLR